jgi:phage-related minor tail protein
MQHLAAAQAGAGHAADAQIAQLQRLVAMQTQAASALSRQQEINAFTKAVEGEAAALQRTHAQMLELRAAELGLTQQLGPLIAKIKEAEQGFTGMGKAQKLAHQQMALIGPQMTDIITQLQGGQAPLTILIQQGGQLADVFGGVGKAIKGVGQFLLAQLTNPVVLLSGAIIGLGAAYLKGAEESAAFARSITLTGNAAGITEGQFNAMARSIAESTNTTIGSARSTLQTLVSSGQLSGDALTKAATATQLLSKVTGESADTIAKRFADAADSPSKFAAELNKQYHILSAAQQKQIKELEDQGRTQEALTKTFDALNERLDKAAKNMSYVEHAWEALKVAASKPIDFIINWGRNGTIEDALSDAQRRLDELRSPTPFKNGTLKEALDYTMAQATGQGDKFVQGAIAAQQALVDRLHETVKLGQSVAQSSADRVKSENAIAAALDAQNTYKGKQAQLDKALGDYYTKINAALIAPTITEELRNQILASIPKDVAEIREKFKENKGSNAGFNAENRAEVETVRQAEQIKLEIIKQAQDAAAALRQMNHMSETDAIQEQMRLDLQAMQVRRDSLLQQAAIVKNKENSQGEARNLERQAAVIEEQMTTRRLKGEKELAVVRERLVQLGKDNAAQQFADALKEETEAATKAADSRREYLNTLYDQRDALADEQKLLDLEISMLGRSDEERRTAVETLKIQLKLEKDLQELRRGDKYSPEAEKQLEANAAKQIAQVQQKVYLDEWKKTSDQIEQALMNALMNGGKSGADYIRGLFRSMVLQPVLKAIVQPVAGSAATVVNGIMNGGSSGSGFSPGNAGSLIGNLGSLGGYFGAGGMMGALSAGAGWMTGATTFTGALSAAGSLIGTGTMGGVMSGAMMGLGAVAPYLAAAYALYKVFGRGGTPHRGGAYTIDTDGTDARAATFSNTPGFGLEWGAYRSDRSADVDKAVQGLTTSIAGTIGAALRTFSLGTATVAAKFASDNDDPSRGGLLVRGTDGRVLINSDGRYNKSATKGFEEFANDAGRLVRDALVNADLPGWADEVLRSIGDAPSLDAIQAAVQEIQALVDASKTLGVTLGITQGQLIAMARDMGGASNFASAAGSYVDAIYSDAEKISAAQRSLAHAFDELGLAAPSSREQFRSLVEAQNLNTEAGRRMYEQLILLAPVFGQIQDAAAQAAQEQAQKAAALQQERRGIEQQILQLEGNKTELRRRELDQLDPSNRALQQYLYTLQDAQEAAQQAAAVQQQRSGLETTLLQLQGDTTELRRRELEALDPANRAIQQLIYNLQDQQSATEKAAQVAEQRKGLETQLLELQGNTAELRRRELAALDPSNRALQEQIYALQDAAKAAEEAQKLRDAWKSVGDTIADEIRRIRGLGATQDNSYAYLQAQFATATAQARAGDQDAAKKLPELSKALLDAANNSAGTAADLARIQAATAASLETTMRLLQSLGVDVPAFASGGLFGGGVRLVGENGPELEVTGPSRIFNAEQTARFLAGGGMEVALRTLQSAVEKLRLDMRTGHAKIIDNTGISARVLDEAAQGARPLNTTDASA